jgi:hypothetical protein
MAGYRTWTDEDRLTPDDLNNLLMAQSVPRFASTVERDAAMGGTVAGQLSYVVGTGLQLCVSAGVWVPLLGTGGVVTLVAGTAVVTTTAVSATSRIQLTAQTLGTVTAPSALMVSDRTAGTSFTILASQVTDTSVIAWLISPV